MSSKRYPENDADKDCVSDFEESLRQLSPANAQLDLTCIDQCVAAEQDTVSSNTASPGKTSQWRVASVSWLVGLASGLLIATFGGKILDIEFFQHHSAPIAKSTIGSNTSITVEPTETAANTANDAAARTSYFPIAGWPTHTDYMAEFSPANVDSPHRMSLASRELLIGFTMDDPTAAMGEKSTTSTPQRLDPPQHPASLGQLSKKHRLAL